MENKKDNKTEERLDNFSYYSNLYKRTEKLTTALYMVTDFLSDNEPMKQCLRKKGLKNLTNIFVLKDTLGIKDGIKDKLSFTLKTSVSETVSLLEISKISGLISEMNITILKREYDNLMTVLDHWENFNNDNSENILPSDFFNINENEKDNLFFMKNSLPAFNGLIAKEVFTKDDKRRVLISQSGLYKTDASLKFKGQDNEKYIKKVDMSIAKKNVNIISNNLYPKVDRRESILNIIKDKKEVMIKDISQNIGGCSEKTIQRELIAMVKDNLLKKEGERRWSKYSLNLSLAEK